MKLAIIFLAIIIFAASDVAEAQTTGTFRLTFSGATTSGGRETTSLTYTGLESANVQVFEALLAGPVSDCFEKTDFSSARRVDPGSVGLAYDSATGEYQLKWTVKRDNRDTCRVLLVSNEGRVDAADYVVWRKTDGTQLSDGSVRPVRYSIGVNTFNAQPVKIKIKNPGLTDDVVEASFPASSNDIFSFFETTFAAQSEQQCLANQDFSGAVPVGTDRAVGVFDPATASYFLRNSNSAGDPAEECHVLLLRSGGTTDGYNLWRTNFGRTSFTDESVSPGMKTGDSADIVRTRRTTVASYVFEQHVTNE